MRIYSYLLPILLLCFATTLSAEIKLPALFSSNMVLQQNTEIPIRGKATPNKRVTLVTSWNKKRHSAMSDSNGLWQLTFTTPQAGGPYSIVISDGKPLALNNVMIGEVWICSGQSNMEMPMRGFQNEPIAGGNMDILTSANPAIRLFTVARSSHIHPQNDVNGIWKESLPANVASFSATAYYFGRLLNHTLQIPIGLIVTAWGGSSIEAWMNQQMLQAFPEAIIPTSTENIRNPHRVPTMLYQAMIHPLTDFPMKGVIWYQGESNTERAHSYARMFQSMVEGWRKNWQGGATFPVYFCQIAPFQYNQVNSAFLREAQVNSEKITPNTAMAVLLDAGEPHNIHPAKKREAGERLALLALQKTYQLQGFAATSPSFRNIEIKNDTVVVHFDHAPLGLVAPQLESKWFRLAGTDRVFHPAKARIVRNRIIVTSAAVSQPVAVRYAFENFVIGDVFSTEGLPVSSFRSDQWTE